MTPLGSESEQSEIVSEERSKKKILDGQNLCKTPFESVSQRSGILSKEKPKETNSEVEYKM